MTVGDQDLQQWYNAILKFDPKTYKRIGEWEDASWDFVTWQPAKVGGVYAAWPQYKPPRRPAEWAEIFSMFPNRENADLNPYAGSRPVGTPTMWWAELCAGLLKQPTFRRWGVSWESLAPRDRMWYERCLGYFLKLRHKDSGMWALTLATAEEQMQRAPLSSDVIYRP
jgi:hypothetical protein